jgi:hypothetical protein
LGVAAIGAQGAASSVLSSVLQAAIGTGGKAAGESIAGAMTGAAPGAGIGFAGQAAAALAAAGLGYSIGQAITSVIDAELNKPHLEPATNAGGQDVAENLDFSIPGIVRKKQSYISYGKDERGNIVAEGERRADDEPRRRE